MTRVLPALDTHAHIEPGVSARDLEGLGAVVFAATRSRVEFEAVRPRRDLVTIWGVGCHPGVPDAHRDFDPSQFSALMDETALVSEIGLDGRSPVPLDRQIETFTTILYLIRSKPRLASVHSFGATDGVLDCMERTGLRGAILHWWLGSVAQTERGLSLGCYFSINHAMTVRPELVRLIPLDRLLLETDHPAGDRRSATPRQPGAISDIEEEIGKLHGLTGAQLRAQTWRNLDQLVISVGVLELLPIPVQRMLTSTRNSVR